MFPAATLVTVPVAPPSPPASDLAPSVATPAPPTPEPGFDMRRVGRHTLIYGLGMVLSKAVGKASCVVLILLLALLAAARLRYTSRCMCGMRPA